MFAAGAINVILGSGLKMLGVGVQKYFELKRQERLASINADTERIKVLQGGEDTADTWSKWTRRVLALTIVGTLCFVVVYHVVFRPDAVYRVMIDKDSSFLWGFFFDSTQKTTIEISAGSLLWNFVNFVEIISGFYFTKMGK